MSWMSFDLERVKLLKTSKQKCSIVIRAGAFCLIFFPLGMQILRKRNFRTLKLFNVNLTFDDCEQCSLHNKKTINNNLTITLKPVDIGLRILGN